MARTLIERLFSQPLLVSDRELVAEILAPVVFLSQVGECALEAAVQELLTDVQALELVHGPDLLLTLDSCVLERLVLLLDT